LLKPARSRPRIAAALARIAAFLIACQTLAADEPARLLIVGPFSSTAPGSMPAGWTPLTFRGITRLTRYEIATDTERGSVMRATSDASASALVRHLDVDPRERPILRWEWKVDNLIRNADVSRREGDDYPARIYVSFKYDPSRVSLLERAGYAAARLFYGEYPPQGGLNYIWDGKAARGTLVPNPNTSRVAMIVVESGGEKLHQWQAYERNIIEDYRRAFGEDPPPISGVAIMTDSDNTRESASASYGDITLSSAALVK
jgi:hypothetical protein